MTYQQVDDFLISPPILLSGFDAHYRVLAHKLSGFDAQTIGF